MKKSDAKKFDNKVKKSKHIKKGDNKNTSTEYDELGFRVLTDEEIAEQLPTKFENKQIGLIK